VDDSGDNIGWFGASTPNVEVTVAGANDMHIEAEDYTDMFGIQTETTGDTGGGLNVGYIATDDWMEYDLTIFQAGSYEVAFRVASLSQGINFDFQQDGNTLCSVNEPATGAHQTYVTVTKSITLAQGTTTLKFLATGGGWNINWFELYPTDGNSPPQITSSPDLYADVSATYNYTLTATDPDSDPITFAEYSTPAWLTFTPETGLLTGTPAVGNIGTSQVMLDVSDGINTIQHDFTITVSAAGNDAPVITSTPVTGVVKDGPYSYTVTATDADGDAPLTYSTTTKPAWLTLSGSTVSGTPTTLMKG
jgi:hypothetical protein